jgi:hypothetical protein
VAALVQGGMHGADAAGPITRAVIKAYYDKKTAREGKSYTVNYKRIDFPQEQNAGPLLANGESQPGQQENAQAAGVQNAKTDATR